MPYELNIFRTISPIKFKLKICFHIILRIDAIDYGPPAEYKMAHIKIFYRHTRGEAPDVTMGVAKGDGCVLYNCIHPSC